MISTNRAIFLLLTPIVLVAQTRQEQPTFKTGIEQIEVDVLVTDGDGRVVRGLLSDDFTVFEDDAPQAVSNFSFVDLPIDTPGRQGRGTRSVEADVVNNTDTGRTYVMLLNAGGERARLIARRFVEEAVGPHDEVAVVTVHGNVSSGQGFTRNRSLILAAVDRLYLDEPPFVGNPNAISFQVAEEMAERLGRINGRRKALLWFFPPSLFIPDGSADSVDSWFAQRDAIRAATRNNVALYVIGGGIGGSLEHQAGLRVLAEDTGGDVIVNTNNFSPAFQRFAVDNSSYYLLAYTPMVEHRDGKFHKITVRVKRPGVNVRARRGYYAPTAEAEKLALARRVEGLSVDTTEALRMPSAVPGLGIEAFAVPFKGEAGRGSVLLGATVRGSDLVLDRKGTIEFAYQAMTPEGKQTPGAFKVFTLDFRPESRATLERTGVRFIDRLRLPRGRHQVRFVVHQPGGRTGSVVADVEVPDYRADLLMSGVVIGSERMATNRTLLGDKAIKSMLSSDPVTARRFTRRDVLSAFAEVYFSEGLAPRGTATVTPTSATGKPSAQRIFSKGGEPGKDGWLTEIRLSSFNPGDYVLTLEARTASSKAMQQVPFTVLAD